MPQRGRSRFLGRPASRSCSSTEQEPGHRGESVSDGRPIACAWSSFVRLLGSGAFIACGPTRAREWVRLGSPVAVARRGSGSRAGVCAAPRLGVCRDLRYLSTRGTARVRAPRLAGCPRRACWSKRRALVLGSGRSGMPSVWSIQRVPPRADGSAVGVTPCGRSDTAPDASRFVSWSCGYQVALDRALSRLSAEARRAGRSAQF